ncbi:MAG: hypothetical protein KIT61_09205 [Pyrinomonadaceae bacterium]|nr:hypothetical protein [Pyrinomonadaceae bacterium]
MAFLYDVSFRVSSDVRRNQPYFASDMDYLHKTLNSILTRISTAPFITEEGRLYTKVPKKLSGVRGDLKRDYGKIWDDVIVVYDGPAYGATANHRDLVITFGEFFTKPQPELILEKVLWHELLHLLLDDEHRNNHHVKIDRIIRRGLKLPGDPNPLGTVGMAC